MIDLDYLQKLEQLIIAKSNDTLGQYFKNTTAHSKSDGSIVTEADIQMQHELSLALTQLSPQYSLLGEEMSPADQLDIINSGAGYWCLDPLDGTNNFHHGVPLFAVSLALIIDQEIRIGLIYDPVRTELFSTLKGTGLRINSTPFTKPPQPELLHECLASVDFKRLDITNKQRLVKHMPFKSQRNIGSCALEWAWLACGRTQLVLHGAEKFWDYAAGSLLVSESNGFSCTLEGDPVYNNSLQDRSVVAASSHNLQQQWFAFNTD